MAETITNVLQITTQDTDNNSYSFNIENPNNNVTIQQVNAALEPLINTQKWYSTKNKTIVRVKNATLTRTRKVILDDSTEITVTPAEWTITQNNSQATETFTVTGEAIQAYNFVETSSISGGMLKLNEATINTINNTLTITIELTDSTSNITRTGTLTIVTTTQTLSIPITFTKS